MIVPYKINDYQQYIAYLHNVWLTNGEMTNSDIINFIKENDLTNRFGINGVDKTVAKKITSLMCEACCSVIND